MHRDHVSKLMDDLRLTQLVLVQLTQISAPKLSRFLNGSLDLDAEETLRLSKALSACWFVQNGLERLSESLPVNWNDSLDLVKEKMAADPEAVRDGWNDFEADVEFFSEREIAALTIAVPLSAMIELMESPDKFIKIGRGEVLHLFKLKLENPETPVHDCEAIKNLLTFVPELESEDAERLQAVLETK
ncbi:MAG: hypothetical protein WBF09_05095 [Candidatus Acidiferrum sp.]